MTVLVGIFCTDGVVVAADSMLSARASNQTGKKVSILSGNQVYGWAGDNGLAQRFGNIVDKSSSILSANPALGPLDYGVALSQAAIDQFKRTGFSFDGIALNAVLGLEFNGTYQCCVFEGSLQPRALDSHHFYFCTGSGQTSAHPFLKFISNILCRSGQPNLADGIFIAAWTIRHTIDTAVGGVAEPIRIATISPDNAGAPAARELTSAEIDEHLQAIDSANEALRKWRDDLISGAGAGNTPSPP